jgi:hypothetical protein
MDVTNNIKVASVNEILATRARATFSHRINFQTIGYESLDLMREWCKDHCTGLWRLEHVHALYFQFENDRDATMFMLRWGGAEGNKLK